MFFLFLVGFVDTFLAGHISKEANNAVGTAVYVSWLLTTVFTLVGTGAAALVARCFGAGDRRTANRVVHQAVLLGGLAGLATTLLAFMLAPLLAHALMRTPESEVLCIHFLRIDAFGYAAAALTAIIGGVLRASGDTRTPMGVMTFINVLNVLLTVTFVKGWVTPPLGAVGIALGTLIARCAGAVVALWVVWRGTRGLRLRLRRLWPEPKTIARILRVGIPAAGDAATMSVAQMTFVWVVSRTAAGEAATVNLAAHMIAMRLEAISYLPAIAWMTAAAATAGQYLGAGRPQEATRAGHAAARQGMLVCAVIGATFYLLADWFYIVMSSDPEVRRVGAHAFQYLGCVQPFLAAAIIYTGALRGVGDTRTTFFFAVLSSVGVRLPLGYLCGPVLGWGLLGAWVGMWSDNVVKAALGYGRFRQGGWQRVVV